MNINIKDSITMSELSRSTSRVMNKVAFGEEQILVTFHGKPHSIIVPVNGAEQAVQAFLHRNNTQD